MNNTWVDIGPMRSVNLAAPVRTSECRQILEACASIKIEQVLMDPMICMLFEVVLEVRITTHDRVYKELVTLATFQYLPKITLSRFYPVELGDDYILETKPA